ncbi:hypothetical protein [Amycolatopsis thermophila]|uniref:DUF2218 domain-containing protein n=1 Tax=Amycolatopsis thermophila TaxID=206084 RepID=A0ABU0ENK3_9PSEU|nr:hypothetical protein [Amycolatopsis thermophila]MDQ0376581.1 hypothetical protein [Amycolatopsis thermophila]
MQSTHPLLGEAVEAAAQALDALLREHGFTRPNEDNAILNHPTGVTVAITPSGYRISFAADGQLATIDQPLHTRFAVIETIAAGLAKHLAEVQW